MGTFIILFILVLFISYLWYRWGYKNGYEQAKKDLKKIIDNKKNEF